MVNHTSLFLELGKVNEAEEMLHLIGILNNQVDNIVGYGRENNLANFSRATKEKDEILGDSNP